MEISFRHHCQRWLSRPQRLHMPFFSLASPKFGGIPLRASSIWSFVNRGFVSPDPESLPFPFCGFFAGGAESSPCAPESSFGPHLRLLPFFWPESWPPCEFPRSFSSWRNRSWASPISLMATIKASSSSGTPPRTLARSFRRFRQFHLRPRDRRYTGEHSPSI